MNLHKIIGDVSGLVDQFTKDELLTKDEAIDVVTEAAMQRTYLMLANLEVGLTVVLFDKAKRKHEVLMLPPLSDDVRGAVNGLRSVIKRQEAYQRLVEKYVVRGSCTAEFVEGVAEEEMAVVVSLVVKSIREDKGDDEVERTRLSGLTGLIMHGYQSTNALWMDTEIPGTGKFAFLHFAPSVVEEGSTRLALTVATYVQVSAMQPKGSEEVG